MTVTRNNSMDVKYKKRAPNLKWSKVNEITDQYVERITHAYNIIKNSADFLDYKKKNGTIDNKTHTTRLKCLVNMTIVYFYSLYEGFTRKVFRYVAAVKFRINEKEFNDDYHKPRDLFVKFVRKQCGIRIPDDMFEYIMIIKNGRNDIVHEGQDARAEFKVIRRSYRLFIHYFNFIRDRIIHLIDNSNLYF